MGKEANVSKDRTCRVCGQVSTRTAKEIKAHAKECKG